MYSIHQNNVHNPKASLAAQFIEEAAAAIADGNIKRAFSNLEAARLYVDQIPFMEWEELERKDYA